MELADRFWMKVDKNGPTVRPELGPCWIWLASRRDKGYGQFMLDGMPEKSHRVAWFLEHGLWSEVCVLHRCDNPPCVRPSHLFEGTVLENNADMLAKGRNCKGTAAPSSKLTVDNVLTIRRLFPELDQHAIGRLFGVTAPLISMIVNRKRWAHV